MREPRLDRLDGARDPAALGAHYLLIHNFDAFNSSQGVPMTGSRSLTSTSV